MNLLDKVWAPLCIRSLSFGDFKHSNVALVGYNVHPRHIVVVPKVKQLDFRGWRSAHHFTPHFCT